MAEHGPGTAEPGARLRFDDYVDWCLYDREHGFYSRGGQAGRARGDFITSVEVGPLFGAVVARALDAWWDELGRPARFDVVEVGAGRGALARAILSAAPRCSPALGYTCVETSASLRAAAVELVGDRAAVVATMDEAMPGGAMTGVVLANELLDNLPFRLFERTGDGWSEVFVEPASDLGAGRVLEALVPVPDAVARLEGVAPGAAVGQRVPLQERAAAWVADTVERLEGGRLVVVDYADRSTSSMAQRGQSAWLRTYAAHGRGSDPYDRPGERDITVEVAIDQLPAPAVTSTQAEFLRRWGIDELVDEGRRIWVERAHVGDLAAVRARSRIVEAEALLDPGGLGAFVVCEWLAPDHP